MMQNQSVRYYIVAVTHEDFKTCAHSGFCKRNRDLADEAFVTGKSWSSPYALIPDTLTFDGGILSGVVRKGDVSDEHIQLPIVMSFYDSGAARVVIDEEKRMQGLIELRHDSKANEKRYDEAWKSLLNLEHWIPKGSGEDSNEDESTWWEKTFAKFTDSKPRGPKSAMDIKFTGYSHVFGIPEHADKISLRETRGDPGNHEETYRLYNSDVFEYKLNSPMSLYGAIPYMQAHRVDSTVGVFWLNAAETWIDIVKQHDSNDKHTSTHWISESGRIDLFIFLGDKPKDIGQTYGRLNGYPQLPQQFAIGYHQCRWNYMSDEDVMTVGATFDKHQIPYDTIWLDIEYMDERKYFTWDPLRFPNPKDMQKQLMESERKLVVLMDSHIKKESGYFVSDELRSKALAVLNKDNKIYDGSCWPGLSNWIDAFNPAAAAWLNTLHKYDRYEGSCSNLFIENDMGEQPVFHGPELTMPRDNIHHGNWEHRDVHNLNGLTIINATFQALLDREANTRPFILTRSFYSGSQRLTAMWTGDNQAKWEHLAISLPMILTNGIAGFPFAGADVGGFFDDPDVHLLTRWYQAGIWYPFFRAHAHLDRKRREPYLIQEPGPGGMAFTH
ncbi:hypothetical protein N7478_008022 [Penicillium angulare]|uniref:uncharacterized protein n=1 Tax=Penicillium angulare TaxID=116970 RepID=UPI002540C50A|nr:uncharacterized protein N7478_008022 [Penicillium angulare]KAJ5272897.1 hypothetical protein N7478_008022 [Penicillium angulare]